MRKAFNIRNRQGGLLVLAALCLFFVFSGMTSCGVYSFNDIGTIPDSIKTVRVNFFENRAPYVNPQLSPNLTDRLRRKIINQTKLSQTNNDNAHWDIRGTITDYSVSTSGISSGAGQNQSQSSINRLTVAVEITLTDTRSAAEPQKFNVSRSFDFGANQSLQAAEAALLDEMVRNLTDEIFNRIFSNW